MGKKAPTGRYGILQAGYWMDYLILFSFAAVFLNGRGFTTGQIGTVTAAASILSMAVQQYAGSLADRSERVTLKGISIFFVAVNLACVAALWLLPRRYLSTFVFYTVALSLRAAFAPILNSLSLEFTNNGYDLNFGLARAGGSVGYSLCAAVMGGVVERFGPEVILPIFLVISAAELALLWLFPRPERAALPAQETVQEEPSTLPQFLRRYKRYLMTMLAFILMFFPQFLMNTYIIYFVRYFGGGETEMGRTLSLMALSEIPTMLVASRVMKKIGSGGMLRISAVFGVVKMLLILFCPSIRFFVLISLTSLLFTGPFNVAAVFFCNAIVGERDRVKAQTLFGLATSGICATVANYLGGIMFERMSIPAISLVCVVSSALGMLVLFLASSRRRFANDPIRE